MQPVSDFQLLAETSADNPEPFREFYRRHAVAIYDFAWRILKNAEAAEDVVRETFREAFDSAGMVVRPTDVRTWLYAIAYRAVLARWESGTEPSEGPPPSPPALVPPDAEVEVDPDTAALVWEAASGLDPRHYALLDLDVRQDFDSGDIAVITGQNRAQTVSLVARLERVVENAMLAYIVARRGVASCDQLRIILGDARIPPFPPDLRALVDRHIEACDTCYALRQRAPSPLETLAAFEPVTPSGEVLDALLAEVLGEAPPPAPEPSPEAEAVEEASPEAPELPTEAPDVSPPPTPASGGLAEASAAARLDEAFPAEGLEEEPDVLVIRGAAVRDGAPAGEPAAVTEAAPTEPVGEPLPEAPWPPPAAVVSQVPEVEGAPEPAAEPAIAPGGAPPRGPRARWREWLERPWVSFGVGVAGGLVVIAVVAAFMFASGGDGGGAETPTPSPTATPEPTELPVVVPTATDTPEPTPTDTPVPEPTIPPTPEPTATPTLEPTPAPVSPTAQPPQGTGTPSSGTPTATPTP